MTGRRRRMHTFRRLSLVLSQSNYPFKRAHSSLYGQGRTTVLRLLRCRTLPRSLQTCLSSRCVLVFHFARVCQTTTPTTTFSERLVSLTLPHNLRHQDGLCVISSRTFARCTQKRRRRCECYAGAAMDYRVVSVFCTVVQRARRNRAQSGGKRMYRVNLVRESPTLRR